MSSKCLPTIESDKAVRKYLLSVFAVPVSKFCFSDPDENMKIILNRKSTGNTNLMSVVI